eukprot:1005251-Rhodomonas_salina.1
MELRKAFCATTFKLISFLNPELELPVPCRYLPGYMCVYACPLTREGTSVPGIPGIKIPGVNPGIKTGYPGTYPG